MRKITHQENVLRQEEKSNIPRIPLTVVIHNVRSLYNVGSIFRTADGAGVEKVWICGYTGKPPNNQISKTALGAEESVPWGYREDVISLIKELKEAGYKIVLLEQMKESVLYQDFKPQSKVCLVLGNEIEGISEDLLSLCDIPIEIEMAGLKNSLNVAVAFGIVAYHIKGELKKN